MTPGLFGSIINMNMRKVSKMEPLGQARGAPALRSGPAGLAEGRNPASRRPTRPRASPWSSGAWITALAAAGLLVALAVSAQTLPDFSALFGTTSPQVPSSAFPVPSDVFNPSVLSELKEPLLVVATPSSPSPGETITVEARMPTYDRNFATFSWTVNGVFRSDLSGPGKHTFALTAGGVGSAETLNVRVSRPDGTINSASLTIRVSDLAVTWSAETYVPKWYKGRTLPSQGSVVAITAIPQFVMGGVMLRPETLIYRWGLDEQKPVLAGVGRQIFRVQMADLPGASHVIRLTVEDANKRIRKEKTIFVPAYTPRAVIYGSSPLGGIETRRAIFAFASDTRGLVDFIAEPFFFPVTSRKSLTYVWDVGGNEISGSPENAHLLTVDTQNQPARKTSVTLRIGRNNSFAPPAEKIIDLILQ